MKIVLVSGSKRKGNSEFIAKEIKEAVCQNPNVELVAINLSDMDIAFCNGCLYCDETQKCNIEDDMSNCLKDIVEADGFILISPVRWSLISGEMKTFMDRLNPLAVPMLLSGKKCVTIAVGQSDASAGDSVKAASCAFKMFADNAEMEIVKQIEVYSCLSDCDVQNCQDAIGQCVTACKDLIKLLGE